MAIVTGDRYLDLLASFVEEHAGGLLDGSLVLKLNPVGLHYVQTRLDSLHELERLRAGAPVDYMRAYISDLGDHRALEQLSRVLSLLTSVKVVSVLQSPNRDPAPVTLSPFVRLKSLELRGCDLSSSAARGLLQLRPILERLICHNSADALRHIFADRILEVKDSPVWSRLAFVSCAANGMVFMDDSLQLLPAVQFLDLSRNRFAKAGNLHRCAKLKFLDLGFNQLRNISSLRQIKSQITKLVLKNNTLVSVHGIASLTSLEALDLSNNLISKFKEIQAVAKLPSLQSILLEGNPLSASDFYREEVFSLFQDPAKVVLDGRKILQSEFWTVNRIKSKRLKQEALYGSYAPAEVSADNPAGTMPTEHTDSGSESGASISRRKSLRLALIHDAQTLLKEVAEQDESPGFDASRNLSRDVKDFLEEGSQDKSEAMHLMQKVEALKEEGSNSWLQELRMLLDNSNNSGEQAQESLDRHKETTLVRMDSKLKELHKIQNRRRRHRSFGESSDANEEKHLNQHLEWRLSSPFERGVAAHTQISEGNNKEDTSQNFRRALSGRDFTVDSPRILAAAEAVSGQDSNIDTHQEGEEPYRMTNVDITMQFGSMLTAQPSMDEGFNSRRLIDEVIDSQGSGDGPMSPPHYHEGVLQKRQDLEEELLRLSLDSGCASSSSESESSSDDSLIMISASSRSEESSPRGLADFMMGSPKSNNWNSWQGSALESNVPTHGSEESTSSDPNDGKGLESLDAQHSLPLSVSKVNSTEASRSSHLSPSCTDDIRANAGGGLKKESSEMVVSKPRVKRKPRRVRTVDLYKEVDDEGKCSITSAVLNEDVRSDHMTASSVSKQLSSHASKAGQCAEHSVEGESMACAPDSGDGSDTYLLEDYVEKFFRLKIANAEENEVCSRRVKCGCIRLWEETPSERDVYFLLSNKDKLYMIAESSSRNGKWSASGSDNFGLHVLASHRLQEVKKIMVGLGLQTLRVDIGHGASYLLLARDINLSREILEMLRKVENNGTPPEFESWEQNQLKLFEELVLGGTQTNILMYMMPLFSHGSSLEDMWMGRSVFLTSHRMFICIEDLMHFGARSEDLVTAHPYFVMEAAADVFDLLEVVAGLTDDCVTLHFSKTVTGSSTPVDGDKETRDQQSTVWKFKGILGEAASKLVALLHASHIDFTSEPPIVNNHKCTKRYFVQRFCADFLSLVYI